jgi:membrane-associated phospholipid phosphatase
MILILSLSGLLTQAAFPQHQVEPSAGTWKTWILRSGNELRLPPPPGPAETRAEIRWLKDFMAQPDPQAAGQIAFWDAGAPPLRWIEMVNQRILNGAIPVPQAPRPLVLLSVALHDAMVAAWDSKYAYNRGRPGALDRNLTPLLAVPHSPSYPAEHAVAAGAAAAVLGFLYPAEAARFNELAEEAGRSRLFAGLHYPSDVEAGLQLGRAVGQRVVEYAAADGFTVPWTGTVPTGPGLWIGSNPIFANAPGWKPFVLSSASELRPPAPPAHDSPQTLAEIAELKALPHPFPNTAKAMFWQTPEGNYTWFIDQVTRRLFEYRLDTNPPRAARAYALMGVTMWDMFIASHDAKMTYWRIRPSQLDSTVPLLFPPPNHPSFPANHALSWARANLLGYLFPQEAPYYRQVAEEIGLSRMWAGIHYRSDVETGWEMARRLLQKVVARAESDGSRR